MNLENLAKRIFELPRFQERYKVLAKDSVQKQFTKSFVHMTEEGVIDWPYMLEVASVLSQSSDGRHEEAALRIAQHCLRNKLPLSYHYSSSIILDTLTNRASLNLAIDKELLPRNIFSLLPPPLQLDRIRREIQFSEKIGDKTCYFNRYQRVLWDSLNECDRLSTSAPTSTGKSFLIKSWIGEFLNLNNNSVVAYIVPTRALISQVELDFKEFFIKNYQYKVNVTSIPSKKYLKIESANVFVLTQERLHFLIADFDSNLHVDALVVDEAHKIGDGARGVLLEQAIQSILASNEKCKVIFASPMVTNPEILLKDEKYKNLAVTSEHTTVNQNQIWVSPLPSDSLQFAVEYCYGDELVELGRIKLPFRPTHASKRLTFVSYIMSSKDGGNLIYVNGAADAEKAAQQLCDLIEEEIDLKTNEEIQNLIDLIKVTVHPKYSLINTLKKGVAFHYGNMPLGLKEQIEKLYGQNLIKYLICTSTLVEGVNLPCKTIFMRGPQKGRGKPMNSSDFWNLCGRAGRLGKEFQGNIVCVDPKDSGVWKSPPPRRRISQAIVPSTNAVMSEMSEFIKFIENEKIGETYTKKPEFESVYNLLALSLLKHNKITTCQAVAELSLEEQEILSELIKKSLEQITVPVELIQRNPGISPVAMQSLLNYFDTYEKDLVGLIPLLPEHGDAVQMYTRIFSRIDKHLSKSFRTTFRDAVVVVSWMRGYPLSRIISERIKVKTKKNQAFTLPAIIRDTMEDVEKIARFLAPKYSSCYLDLLRYSFMKRDREDLIESLPPLHMWLEFGTSQQTQLSLISLGLSRASAIALSELMVDDQMDEAQALSWICKQDVENLSLSKIACDEIIKIRDLNKS